LGGDEGPGRGCRSEAEHRREAHRRKGDVTDVLTEYATGFLGALEGQTFMLMLAHKAVHPNVTQRDDGSIVPLEIRQAASCPPNATVVDMPNRQSRDARMR
jgi:hypothetical protein